MRRYPRLPERLLLRSRVISNRWDALALWPRDAVIVEVGVGLGDFSASIMKHCAPRQFIAIDSFDLHTLETLWGKPTSEHFGPRTHRECYEARFADEIAGGGVRVIQGDSAQAIASLDDDSVDVFYVDADHRYEFVKRDLDALLPKLKRDGWLIMNDYIPMGVGYDDTPYGVIQATNELMVEDGWEMAYFALAHAMYCDVGLRRVGVAPGPVSMEHRALHERAAELEAELAAVYRSKSWKVTAPLRRLVRRLSRG